jgi:hypothetical protein
LTRKEKYLLKRQEGGPGQDGETGVDLVGNSDYSKGRKVVLGRMERQVVICLVKVTYSKGKKVVRGRMERQVLIL